MFKSLYKETEGFRLGSILTPLCMIGEVVMEMIIPKLMSSIIDDGVTAGNLSHIYRIGGWMIVAAAFGLLFGVLALRRKHQRRRFLLLFPLCLQHRQKLPEYKRKCYKYCRKHNSGNCKCDSYIRSEYRIKPSYNRIKPAEPPECHKKRKSNDNG